MAHVIKASVELGIGDDPKGFVGAVKQVGEAWEQFMAAIGHLEYHGTFTVNEVKATVSKAPYNGKPRGRKPKTAADYTQRPLSE